MNLELVATIDADNPIEHDLRLTDHELTLIDDAAAVRQHLINRLKFFLGEWFLDQRQGFPYFRDVFVKNPNLRVIQTLYRKTIQETPGIASVDDLTLNIQSNRIALLSFTARLDDSDEPLVFSDFIIEV